MYIVIGIILIITSYIIGYKSSTNRLKADNVEWLKNRLTELGHPIFDTPQYIEVEKKDVKSVKKTPENDLEEIVQKQKAQIKQVFLHAIKSNIAKGDYSFDHVHDSYSILPQSATKTHLSELITEFQKANPSIKIKGSLLYSEYKGKYFIRMNVTLV